MAGKLSQGRSGQNPMESMDVKITAGMGHVMDYEALIKAGADEIFCGFVPLSWSEKYGSVFPLNRREVFFVHVQLTSYEDMEILAAMMAYYKVPVVITLNSLSYRPDSYEDVGDIVKKLAGLGFLEYILADFGLALYLESLKLSLSFHFSGELGEYNTESIVFLKEKLPSLKRIIFHRKNSLSQMEVCKRAYPDLDFEAFVLNEMCHYTGGFCNSLHCDEMDHLCMLPYRLVSRREETKFVDREAEWEEEGSDASGYDGCGLCGLYRMKAMGISHVKVVGRGKAAEALSEDIRLCKKAISLLDGRSQAEFCGEIKRLQKDVCGANCYYRSL